MTGIKPFLHIERFKMLIEPIFDFATVQNMNQGTKGCAGGILDIVIYRRFQEGRALHSMVILHIEGKILTPGEEGIKA